MLSSGAWAEGSLYVGREERARFTVLFVQFVNDLRPMTSSSHPTQPGVCKLCEPRSGNRPRSVGVDYVRNQMNRQNEKSSCGEGGGPGDVVEAKRR